ncbi:hypothetical protein [Raoultella terrigena]|uniref:hypothetical protein n=1 Tax=Raoultella terrigena TaxID=577 RepID=UPI00349F4B08
MKSRKDVFIEVDIIASRVLGDVNQPFCIHRVRFSNDKYAIIRAATGLCFHTGGVIERHDNAWFYNQVKIRLFGFEYLGEKESIRQFFENS